jgi:hypothetical protein
MAFDIHFEPFDPETGEFDEEELSKFHDELLKLFAESPEGKELESQGKDITLPSIMIDYVFQYFDVQISTMTRTDLRTILYHLIPEKVSIPAESAGEIIEVLRGFWQFLKRAYQLKNADQCLKELTDKAIPKLRNELANPENYGMVKSIFMMGFERGFNMTTQEGINAWIETYNAEILNNPPANPLRPMSGSPLFEFDDPFPPPSASRGKTKQDKARKKKRKMFQEARKRNRKK